MATRNTARFDIRADDKTRKAFSAVDRRMEKMRGSAAALAGTMVSLAGVAGFGAAIKASADYADSLAKTAKKLGLTTEALAGLQLAAQLTGVETSTLDTGLRNMTRNIADLSRGTGEAKVAFERLGLTTEQLLNLSPDQQFAVIGEALKKVENNTLRVDTAYKIFGGRATALINTLDLGADGLKKVNAQAENLGLALSKEQAEKFEELKDKMLLVKSAALGLSTSLSVNLVDAINNVGDAFLGAVPMINAFFDSFSDIKNRNSIQGIRVDLSALSDMRLEILSRLKGESFFSFLTNPGDKAALVAIEQRMNELNNRLAELVSGRNKPLEIKVPLPFQEFDPAQAQKEFAKLQEQLRTKEEILAESFANRSVIIGNALRAEIIDDQKAKALLLTEEAKFQNNLAKIKVKGLTKLEDFERKSKAEQTKIIGKMFLEQSQIAATQSRAAFEINKVASTANAIVKGIESVQNAYAFGSAWGGPFGGAAMAAIAATATAANVKAIQSASFGGGRPGISAGGGGGGAVPTFNANPVTSLPEPQTVQQAQATAKTDVVINIGDQSLFTDRAVRELIDKIDEQVRDGVVIGSLSVA